MDCESFRRPWDVIPFQGFLKRNNSTYTSYCHSELDITQNGITNKNHLCIRPKRHPIDLSFTLEYNFTMKDKRYIKFIYIISLYFLKIILHFGNYFHSEG